MYSIFAEVTCDLSPQQILDNQINIIPMTVYLDDDIEFLDTYNHENFALADFYQALNDKKIPRTSQASLPHFLQSFKTELEKGNDILYIGFDSKLSGSFNSANIAINELKEDYPDRKLIAIDSLNVSCGHGLLVMLAAKYRKQGLSVEENADKVQSVVNRTLTFGTVDDLFYLRNNGRLSTMSALIGSLIHIKPVIRCEKDGALNNFSTVRSRKNALKAVASHAMEHYDKEFGENVYIFHGNAYEDALKVKEFILATYPVDESKIMLNDCGMVVASHTGPGVVGVVCIGTIEKA